MVALALVGTAFALLVRNYRPELALVVGVATGTILVLAVIGELSGIFDILTDTLTEYGVPYAYIGTLLKIVGIAYATQFGCELCRDAGESAIAARVDLCGRVLILTGAVPAAIELLKSVAELMKGLA